MPGCAETTSTSRPVLLNDTAAPSASLYSDRTRICPPWNKPGGRVSGTATTPYVPGSATAETALYLSTSFSVSKDPGGFPQRDFPKPPQVVHQVDEDLNPEEACLITRFWTGIWWERESRNMRGEANRCRGGIERCTTSPSSVGSRIGSYRQVEDRQIPSVMPHSRNRWKLNIERSSAFNACQHQALGGNSGTSCVRQ